MSPWPPWWDWELELSPHVLKRMVDRGFTESDLRAMMEDAQSCENNKEPGRFVIQVRHGQRPWEIIVEPDFAAQRLVVVTAYPLD